MPKVMLVNVVNEEESRIAIVADGLLEEVAIETAHVEQLEGNIYKGRIVKVVPGLDAVFVDFGAERNGFLPLDDIHPRYFQGERRDASALHTGQDVLVQVRKGELGQKGAALTTYVSLPGRYLVLMPYVSKRGVSRKIEDEAARKQLRDILDSGQIPEEMGYIVRTAAEGRTKQEITRDAGYLLRLWKRIQREYEEAPCPSLLYQESDIVIRTIRDYFTPAIEEVWVDDKEVYNQVRTFFQAVMPWYTRRVKLHQRRTPIFARYNVEDQLATIYEKTVPLPSGGSIVIEQTEALVSIDVNSGGAFQGRDIEETALRINQEAALEAARQLRLRDLGGLIVIDFIDMRSSANRSAVRKILQKALREDKARTDVGTISKFGLLELSRQRLKPAAASAVTRACPTCRGSGRVRAPESFALSVLRMVQAELPRKELQTARVGVPADVATLLLNRKRRQILDLEATFGKSIQIFPEPLLQPNQYYIEYWDEGSRRVVTNVPEEFPRDVLATARGLPEPPPRSQRAAAYILMEEEPEPPPEETEEAQEAAAEGQEASRKKRRRRRKRRKKKAGEAQEAGAEGAEEQPDAGDRPAEAPPAGEPGAPADAPLSGEAPAEETAAEGQIPARRKRRRRRRKKKEEAPGDGDESSTPTLTEPGEAPVPPPDEGGGTPEPDATEPEAGGPAGTAEAAGTRRRRRPRRRKAAQEPSPEGEGGASGTSSEPGGAPDGGGDPPDTPGPAGTGENGPEGDSSPETVSEPEGDTARETPSARTRRGGRRSRRRSPGPREEPGEPQSEEPG